MNAVEQAWKSMTGLRKEQIFKVVVLDVNPRSDFNFFHAIIVSVNRIVSSSITADQPSEQNPSNFPGLHAYPLHVLSKTLAPDSSTQLGIERGSKIEIVDGTLAHDGIETVCIKDLKTGKTGHAFWSELQASCSIPKPLRIKPKFRDGFGSGKRPTSCLYLIHRTSLAPLVCLAQVVE